MPPHLAGDVSEDLVPVVELDLEHRVREGLDDLALHLDLLFLGHEGGASDEADVHRLRPLVARLLLVLHLGVLGERLEALAVDAGVVDEQVPVSLIGSDEAVALLVVEPLHGSGRHVLPLPACARSLRVPMHACDELRRRRPAQRAPNYQQRRGSAQ